MHVSTLDGAPVATWDAEGRGVGAGRHRGLADVAVSPRTHDVLLLDRGGRVQWFRPRGRLVYSWWARGADGACVRPSGLALSAEGHVAVADRGLHRVLLFQPDGVFVRTLAAADAVAPRLRPDRIALWSGGRRGDEELLFVLGRKMARVCVFRCRDGAFLHAFGSAGASAGQFNQAADLAVTPTGEVLVTDLGRCQVFSRDGAFVRAFGACGAGQWLGTGAHVAVGRPGEVVVHTACSCGMTVHVYD